MTTREEMAQNLYYGNYIDMEHGNDYESIDYRALISVLTRITNDIEEVRVNQANLALSVTNLLNRVEALESGKKVWYHPESSIAATMKEAAEEFER